LEYGIRFVVSCQISEIRGKIDFYGLSPKLGLFNHISQLSQETVWSYRWCLNCQKFN